MLEPEKSHCDCSPHGKHEFQIVEFHTEMFYVTWAICKFCLKKERL